MAIKLFRIANPASLARRALLVPLDLFREILLPRYSLYLLFFRLSPPALVAWLGKVRAIRSVEHAIDRVPAYADFISGYPESAVDVARLQLPPTDKENYIRRYSTELRCVDGKLSLADAAIDESSGSTGTPYNWVRSMKERHYSHLFISHFARYGFGRQRWITINAFSMGAWATGINMGIALQRNSLVKNTGPDLDKIFDTLEFFGTKYRYLVCGYPPFVKQMIDEASTRGIRLERYRMMAMLGGEGNSEGLRDYLSPFFDPIYSGYGATDLEIGIAAETPITVALRRKMRYDHRLKQALLGADERLPMLFQYNPLTHYVATTESNELMFTITRLHMLSPRIMYNIHDEGGVCTFSEIERRLGAVGLSAKSLLGSEAVAPIRLPFLWVYGRADSTVSVMGANIYPEDLEQCLYDSPDLAAITRSYCLGLEESPDANVRPCFSFELLTEADPTLQAKFEDRMPQSLAALNADYRTALAEYRDTVLPVIRLYARGAGPFAGDESKIKQTRLIREPAAFQSPP